MRQASGTCAYLFIFAKISDSNTEQGQERETTTIDASDSEVRKHWLLEDQLTTHEGQQWRPVGEHLGTTIPKVYGRLYDY